MRTIISACLMMFMFLSVCPAGEKTDRNVCPELKVTCPAGEATDQNVCQEGKIINNKCTDCEDTEKSDCLRWNDPLPRSVCHDYKTPATLGEKVLALGCKIWRDCICRKGSCGDFVEAVYNCAGYTKGKRKIVFPKQGYDCDSCGKNVKGPDWWSVKDIDNIKAGDWIKFKNKENMRNCRIEHSAIFVHWICKKQRIALMLDFRGGEKNCWTAKYSTHILDQVYCICRPMPNKEEAEKKHNLLQMIYQFLVN